MARQRWRRLLIALFAVLSCALLAAIGGYLWGEQRFRANGPHAEPKIVLLQSGESLAQITRKLARAGVVAPGWLFHAGVRVAGRARALKAGEYAIPARASMADIMALLVSGKVVQHQLTIPEGWRVPEIMARLAATEPLSGPLPAAPREGSILPETYLFIRGESRADLLARMQAAQKRLLRELWPVRAPDLPLANPWEAVILASIVERETSVAAERPRVAGVFVNRLRKGMRLQSDPTVRYALIAAGQPPAGPLTRRDLRFQSPYNSYQSDGLPPGPIANPGRAAIAAVLQPERTDALYFVADGDGGHVFARSLSEHNANVARYRKLMRARRAQRKTDPAAPAQVE